VVEIVCLSHFRCPLSDVILDLSYIGAPYFSDDESRQIKNTVVSGKTGEPVRTLDTLIEKTLAEKLGRKKRLDTMDFRVCAAHDLAPILERAFNIQERQLRKNKSFTKQVEAYGLDLKEGEYFKGIGKDKLPKPQPADSASKSKSDTKQSKARKP